MQRIEQLKLLRELASSLLAGDITKDEHDKLAADARVVLLSPVLTGQPPPAGGGGTQAAAVAPPAPAAFSLNVGTLHRRGPLRQELRFSSKLNKFETPASCVARLVVKLAGQPLPEGLADNPSAQAAMVINVCSSFNPSEAENWALQNEAGALIRERLGKVRACAAGRSLSRHPARSLSFTRGPPRTCRTRQRLSNTRSRTDSSRLTVESLNRRIKAVNEDKKQQTTVREDVIEELTPIRKQLAIKLNQDNKSLVASCKAAATAAKRLAAAADSGNADAQLGELRTVEDDAAADEEDVEEEDTAVLIVHKADGACYIIGTGRIDKSSTAMDELDEESYVRVESVVESGLKAPFRSSAHQYDNFESVRAVLDEHYTSKGVVKKGKTDYVILPLHKGNLVKIPLEVRACDPVVRSSSTPSTSLIAIDSFSSTTGTFFVLLQRLPEPVASAGS